MYFLYLTEQGITDSRLVGPYFTAADIALTTFLDRIIFLGLADRYFSQNIRPFLYNYFQKLGTRKSVQRVRALVSSIPQLIIIHQIKKASPYLLGVLVAEIAVFVAFRWQWRTSDRTSVIQNLVCHKLHMFINKICFN